MIYLTIIVFKLIYFLNSIINKSAYLELKMKLQYLHTYNPDTVFEYFVKLLLSKSLNQHFI